MKIGFTGTREGMTEPQFKAFEELFFLLNPVALLHGCCLGADKQAHDLAYPTVRVEAFPPVDKFLAFNPIGASTVHPEDKFLDRNKKIVDNSTILIATPRDFNEELRSGTWSTIRYAKNLGKGIYIIYPDGRIEEIEATK